MTTIPQALGLFTLKVVSIILLWCLVFAIIWYLLRSHIHKDEE